MSRQHLPSRTRTAARGAAAGFTLIELVIVMGILSGFLVMLVQLVDIGLRLFADGETGQQYADVRSRAVRRIERELTTLRGSASGRDRTAVEDRLLVQWLPIGLPPRPERDPTRVQVLRAAVHLPPARELALLPALLHQRVLEEEGELPESELEERIAVLLAQEPLKGLGNMILLPWRQEGEDDALLELRAGWFLPGQKLPLDQDRFVDPFAALVPGTAELPGLLVWRTTTPILTDLLHCEFQFWSQSTQRWNRPGRGMTGGTGGGAETIWDSARGGWLVDEELGGVFGLDRGPTSLDDPTDDIHPHAIHVVCVVAQPAELPPEGLLAERIGAEERSLWLVEGDRWPGSPDGGWVKVGGEWMHYGELRGDRLSGLRRGQRRTKAAEHLAGARVHHGQAVEFTIPLPHAKDDWNDLLR